MEYRDYYGTLGVAREASPEDLKKAFRRQARKHHPDVNKGDAAAERRFKELNEAYDVLSDPEKRKLYDQLGANWDAYQRGGGQSADPFAAFRGAAGTPGGIRFEYHGNAEDLSGFSDFFRAFFAGGPEGAASGGARSARSGGSRTHVDLDDLLNEAARSRSGERKRSHRPAASREEPRVDPFAGMRIEYADDAGPPREPLPSLEANTEVTLQEVATGTRRVVQVGERRLEVTIPPGVTDGQRIRLPRTGTRHTADATLIIRVRRDPVFTRDGADLTRDVSLTLRQALLGAEVPVETITGKRLLLRVPEGTQAGRTFRLTGQGLPRFRGEGTGDLLLRARVTLPTRLDERGRRLAAAFLDHVDPAPPATQDGPAATQDGSSPGTPAGAAS
jgi:DnaJ-class molecular chaperone